MIPAVVNAIYAIVSEKKPEKKFISYISFTKLKCVVNYFVNILHDVWLLQLAGGYALRQHIAVIMQVY